jgi:hypothetical protein
MIEKTMLVGQFRTGPYPPTRRLTQCNDSVTRDDAQQRVIDAKWKSAEGRTTRLRNLHAANGKAMLLQMLARDPQPKVAVD